MENVSPAGHAVVGSTSTAMAGLKLWPKDKLLDSAVGKMSHSITTGHYSDIGFEARNTPT